MTYRNVLITSDCVIDKEIGLLKLIQYNYRNTDLFFDGILDDCVLEQQQYLLFIRQNINPLSVIVEQSRWDIIDAMYSQFMERYDDIVDLSCNTKIFELLKLIVAGETPEKCTIVCNTEHEADVITSRLYQFGHNGVSIITEPNYQNIDLSMYDEIFIRYISQISMFNSLKDKMVFVSDQKCNYTTINDTEVLDLSSVNVDSVDNTLYTFTLYNLTGYEIV